VKVRGPRGRWAKPSTTVSTQQAQQRCQFSVIAATASTGAKVGFASKSPALAGCADAATAGAEAANPIVRRGAVSDEGATALHEATEESTLHSNAPVAIPTSNPSDSPTAKPSHVCDGIPGGRPTTSPPGQPIAPAANHPRHVNYGAAPMEDAYWCVTCRRAWPVAVWRKQQWRCPSGLQTRQQPHPHIGWSLVDAIRRVEQPEENGIDELDN